MGEYLFLPSWPLQIPQLFWLGVVLLGATLLGELVDRLFRLPRILGYVIAGAVLGPEATGLLSVAEVRGLRPFFEVAMGIVLFELGSRVDPGWLRRNPWLLVTSGLESGLAFGAVFGILLVVDTPPLVAAAAGAIAMATSPAVVLTVSRELRAQGQVTSRLQLLTALNSVYSFVVFGILFAWLHLAEHGSIGLVALHPLYIVFGSALLAFISAKALLALLARLGPRGDVQTISAVGVVIVTVSVAMALNLSVVMSMLGLGILTRALDRDRRFLAVSFGYVGQLFVIALFALTGTALPLNFGATALAAGLGIAAARALGKSVAVVGLARLSGLSYRKASLLSVGLLPMSGVAVVMAHEAGAIWPQFGPQLGAVVLAAVLILELLGPLAVQFALRRAGDAADRR
ncbi:MAG: cation:proton antiporter [Betaproteobacteria bacterium]|jgi:Kef-type K+ transport system membrane component KefB|nr:cation:proton antiporter [Betaproteobacteria bacterium]